MIRRFADSLLLADGGCTVNIIFFYATFMWMMLQGISKTYEPDQFGVFVRMFYQSPDSAFQKRCILWQQISFDHLSKKNCKTFWQNTFSKMKKLAFECWRSFYSLFVGRDFVNFFLAHSFQSRKNSSKIESFKI